MVEYFRFVVSQQDLDLAEIETEVLHQIHRCQCIPSYQAVVDFLRLRSVELSNSPRSSLIFTSFPPTFISINAFEVLNASSFFFVILSRTQSHPSAKFSVANFTTLRCPISSHSQMSLDTFSVITSIVRRL